MAQDPDSLPGLVVEVPRVPNPIEQFNLNREVQQRNIAYMQAQTAYKQAVAACKQGDAACIRAGTHDVAVRAHIHDKKWMLTRLEKLEAKHEQLQTKYHDLRLKLVKQPDVETELTKQRDGLKAKFDEDLANALAKQQTELIEDKFKYQKDLETELAKQQTELEDKYNKDLAIALATQRAELEAKYEAKLAKAVADAPANDDAETKQRGASFSCCIEFLYFLLYCLYFSLVLFTLLP